MSDKYTDVIPERDFGELKGKILKNPKITRSETEDRLLCTTEENILLKKNIRKQEERIKQLATKLVRILGERSHRGKREDILVEDQKFRIMELESQIHGLKERLSLCKQQLTSYTKLVPDHHRIAKGARKIKSSSRSITSSVGHPEGQALISDKVAELLVEARTENHSLHNQLKMLHKRWVSTQQELMAMKEQLNLKDVEQEDEMLALRTHMESEQETNKIKLADNIQLIRLQRDAKRTASWLATYEAQCRTLETTLASTNESLQQVESQLATTQEELREEQARSLNLLKQVEDTSSLQHQIRELEAQIVALQDENQILRQSNESLVSKALESSERVKRVENQDDSLKTQNTQLENTIRIELQAKAELISALSQEKAKCLAIEQTAETSKRKSESLAEQLELAKKQINDLQVQGHGTQKIIEIPVSGPCDKCVTFEAEKNQEHWHLIQVQDELLKTKNLLKTQISINKEYHKEIDVLSTKLEKAEVFHNEKLEEFMKIFEEKTSQMSLLEKSIESFNANARARTPPQAFIPCNNDSSDSDSQPCIIKPAPVDTKTEPDTNANLPVEPTTTTAQTILKLNPDAPVFVPGQFSSSPRSPSTPPPAFVPEPPTVTPSLVEDNKTEISQDQREHKNDATASDSKPTLKVTIEKFIPQNRDLLPTLFMTWEHPDLPRKYSPIVSNGIFHTTSIYTLPEDFKMGNLTVELHQAVGASDCRTIGRGAIEQDNSIAEIKNIETGDALGQLLYSCVLTNFNGNNNNANVEEKPAEPTLARPPVPVPRKVKPVPDSEVKEPDAKQIPVQSPSPVKSKPEAENFPPEVEPKVVVPEVVPKISVPAPESVPKTEQPDPINAPFIAAKPPKKSILRKEVPSGSPRAARHVTVNETIEERRFESSLTESFSSGTSSPDEVPKSKTKTNYTKMKVEAVVERHPEPVEIESEPEHHPDKVVDPVFNKAPADEPSSDSMSVKRRARRRNTEDIETDISTASIGSETSRNISEIEDEESSGSLDSAIRIEVSYVVFKQNCRIWTDARIKKFYIEYHFLNYPSQELETDVSLPKPQPGRKAEFNWVKVFPIDTKEKQSLLRDMLKRNIRIQFTLVSEPAEDDAYDCEDIGYAYVSLSDILQENADIVEEEILIFDAENTRVESGIMCVSVQALKALKAL